MPLNINQETRWRNCLQSNCCLKKMVWLVYQYLHSTFNRKRERNEGNNFANMEFRNNHSYMKTTVFYTTTSNLMNKTASVALKQEVTANVVRIGLSSLGGG